MLDLIEADYAEGTQPRQDSLTTHTGVRVRLPPLDGSVRCRVDRHVAELKRYDAPRRPSPALRAAFSLEAWGRRRSGSLLPQGEGAA